MLVINVSQSPRHAAIMSEMDEPTIAADDTASGNVVFATLIDDPASVDERVDAYFGEIMLEAASADDAVNVIFVYAGAIAEAVAAADTQDGTVVALVVARSRFVMGACVNTGASRKAYIDGVMINS